jgi:hypothetical protein
VTEATYIAREMARLFKADRSEDEILDEAQRNFPTATVTDLLRACVIAGGLKEADAADTGVEAALRMQRP